jgi:transposase
MEVPAMARTKPVFKPYNRAQRKLPMEMDLYIPDNHIARVIDTAVERLNLEPLFAKYHLDGRASYHPVMMLKLLIYAYTQRVYSCRSIAKFARENIAAIWLCDGSRPSFRTVNNFRDKRMKEIILEVFAEVVDLLSHLGYINLDAYFLDGTKIAADANPYSWVWGRSTARYKSLLQEKCTALFKAIDELEEEENALYGDKDLPESGEDVKIDSEAIARTAERIDALLAASPGDRELKKLSRVVEKDYLPRMKKYEEQERILSERNSYSKTDHDATFMRLKEDHMKNGQLKPAYNIQTGTKDQFVVGYSVHQQSTDTSCMKGHLEVAQKQLRGKLPSFIVTDAGYGSEENYAYLAEKGLTGYVKYNTYHKEQSKKWRSDPTRVQNWVYDSQRDEYTCGGGRKLLFLYEKKETSRGGYESTSRIYECMSCEGCLYRESCTKSQHNRRLQVNPKRNAYRAQARELLDSELGVELRKQRNVEVESVFGDMKGNYGLRRFSMRGIEKVNLEWGLHSIAHNVRKMAIMGTREK